MIYEEVDAKVVCWQAVPRCSGHSAPNDNAAVNGERDENATSCKPRLQTHNNIYRVSVRALNTQKRPINCGGTIVTDFLFRCGSDRISKCTRRPNTTQHTQTTMAEMPNARPKNVSKASWCATPVGVEATISSTK